jgi:dihydrofolate reductase
MMAGFWPTPAAEQMMPLVAERMNNLPKVVFSRTMKRASWNNTTLVTGDLASAVRALKRDSKEDMVILGSGSIVSQLTELRLIDAYQFVVDPVVLGKGRTMFETVTGKVPLRLASSRTFGNGNVLLSYELVA